MTGDAVIARDPAQIGSTQSEAPKSANVPANVSTAGGNAEDDTAKADTKAAQAKEKAMLKASQKAQTADTTARKISAAKAAKAARG